MNVSGAVRLKQRLRVGRWTVYVYPDGAFEHARHDLTAVRIAWTLDEFRTADPAAAAQHESL